MVTKYQMNNEYYTRRELRKHGWKTHLASSLDYLFVIRKSNLNICLKLKAVTVEKGKRFA